MNYEFSNIEWKLYPHQLKLEFELFHDTKVLDNPIWKDQAKKHLDIDQTIKSTAYRILIKKFKNYFKEEQHRIRTSINNHSIGDPDELFSRYLVTNYKGLIQLEDNSKATKPKRVSFTSSEFTEHYEQQTLAQILYYLQTLFVIPLIDFIETNFSDDIAANNLSTSSAYSQNKFRKKTNLRNRSFNSAKTKLQWKGHLNKLVTIFYDLSSSVLEDGEPILYASAHDIADALASIFVDKNGNDLSIASIKTILKPSRAEKRSPEHKKYKFPS